MGILDNKTAIVTGGSLGIGAAIALELAADGADVALNYRKHSDEAEAIAEQIRKMGRKALVVQADVSSFDDAQKMVDKVIEEWGKLDILVCNAGINRDGVIWKMTEDKWDAVMNINLKGYFNYIRAAAPAMREAKYGRIVCLTSINGMRGKFGQANYAASKAGIIGLVKTVAKELGRANVVVNAVAPGLILTDMMDAMPEEAKKISQGETVVNRLGTPEDVAHVVSFFCSDFVRHVTGEVVKVDGGQYI
ncbi:MAG: 3-oxoacyl-ACP reductase FabG [Calditrichaeota bacterium]|jgi:3-oxoacyl-[acyl-carrier protein] reductase|nr:3-oxoacyl-ACP reductase FabG [Calditrichota bacterium]MBT7617186.1 3-oxoacyl-ACP reductase FabG [Calditrichota bacterium]MBT7788300.1 3-oxoacyl-ACP reductase FabG [Calditrichota bacterium]